MKEIKEETELQDMQQTKNRGDKGRVAEDTVAVVERRTAENKR